MLSPVDQARTLCLSTAAKASMASISLVQKKKKNDADDTAATPSHFPLFFSP